MKMKIVTLIEAAKRMRPTAEKASVNVALCADYLCVGYTTKASGCVYVYDEYAFSRIAAKYNAYKIGLGFIDYYDPEAAVEKKAEQCLILWFK